jgi:thiamine-phosphate diphosphorylase
MAIAFGCGATPPTLYRRPAVGASARTTCAIRALPRPALVFVTPNGSCRDLTALSALAVAAGATVVQLRDRDASDQSLRAAAVALADALPDPRTLVVNAPGGVGLAIAREVGRGVGVHLRECDIEEMMRAVLNDQVLRRGEALVGCSVHSARAAGAAVDMTPGVSPSYVQVGTMFETGSHPGKVPEGPALLAMVRKAVGGAVAIVAIGGITPDNVELLGPVADGVAVISSIAAADDPAASAGRLKEAMDGAWRG